MKSNEILIDAFWELNKAITLLSDNTTHAELDADWVENINCSIEHWQFFYERYKEHHQAISK